MPFLDDAVPAGLAPQIAEPIEVTPPTPPLRSLLGAAFTRDNTIGSLRNWMYDGGLADRAPFNPNFDPFEGLEEKYVPHARAFLHDNSPEERDGTKRRIDDEQRRTELLDQGGVYGFLAQVGAGALDPINLVPGAGQLMAVSRTGRALQGALRTGAMAAGTTALQETGLQATQLTRPVSESAINIAGASVIGGVLGGSVAAYGRPITREIAESASRAGEIYDREVGGLVRGSQAEAPGGSIGAAAVHDTTLAQESIANALGVDKAIAFAHPNMRMMTSPNIEMRRITQDLVELPYDLAKNAEGIPTPLSVERIIKQAEAPLADLQVGFDELFVRYRMGRDKQVGDIGRLAIGDLARRDSGMMTYEQFREAAGRAARNNDTSDVPEVAQAAKMLRDKVVDPLKNRAIAADMLPEDVSVDTAPSYFTRVWNTQKIAAQRPKFERIITDDLAAQRLGAPEQLQGMQAKLAKIVAQREKAEIGLAEKSAALKAATKEEAKGLRGDVVALRKQVEKLTAQQTKLDATTESWRSFAGAEDIDLQDISRQITDHLLHAAPNRSHYLPVPLMRGPLRERTLSIQDKLVEDYLESDALLIAKRYSRTMAADVSLTERFGRADMEQQFDKVREHYAQLREGVTDERRLKRFDKDMKDDLRDLAAVRDRIRGTYGLPDDPNGLANRAFHVVRDLNYLRLLGGMTISALPDLGRAVMTHGMTRVVRDGLVPMLRGFREFKAAANETKLSGTALDMVNDSRTMGMADMLDDYGRWSKYERGLQGLTNKFGMISLMAPWNSGLKQFVGVISQTRTLQAVENLIAGRALPQAERTRLASLGIGQDMAERIDTQFKAHGEKQDNGTWWANTSAWEDNAATDAFRGALGKEVDTAIVTPGQERPLWATGSWGPIGKLIGQFKGFQFAATQRVMMSGLQKRDMATLNGVLLMTTLGMMTYAVRNSMNKDAKELPDPSTPEGMAKWIKEGVDRAGLIGWLFDAHNIVEKATRGGVGLSRLTGGEPMSRYASRGVLESLLGPTAGLITDASQIAGAAGTGEWTESDSSAFRKMWPTQNVFWLRRLFDEAESGINQALGVPER